MKSITSIEVTVNGHISGILKDVLTLSELSKTSVQFKFNGVVFSVDARRCDRVDPMWDTVMTHVKLQTTGKVYL